MKFMVFLLILACSFLISCSIESLTIKIQGHVTAAANDAPLVNVFVQLGKSTGWTTAEVLETTSTDSNGFYYLTYTFKPKEDCEFLYLDFDYQGYLKEHVSWASTPPLSCVEGIQTVDVKLEKSPW